MKKCIYVVEDNAAIREMISFLLTEEEYEVIACGNGTEFWLQMQQQQPDLVVLDVMLPDDNGIAICAKLKENLKTFHIPIMMMSAGNTLNQVKAKCNAEDFINKPFDINDFVNRVERYAPM
jgi:DNA-binding response OmpR family regulator